MTAGTRASSHNKRKDTGGPEEPVVGKKQKKAKSKESAAHSANAPPPSPLTVADKDAPQSEEPAPTSGRASAPRGKKKGTAGKSAAGKKGSATAAEKPTGASRGQSGEAALLDVTGNTTSALTQPHPSPSERREAEKHTSPPHQPPSQDVSHQARDDAAHPNTTSEVDKDKLIASLQARLDARDAKVRKHLRRAGGATDKSSKSKSKKIKPIKKPKGEAGNPTRGGYVLQQAMELDRGDDKQAMYTAIQDDVHRFCAKYDIDYRLGSYNQQCKEKLAKVFRATYIRKNGPAPEADSARLKQAQASQTLKSSK
ncbi:hypothetical protein GGF50DRAFT_121916, partial [Schizophyllum commune]